MKFLNNKYAKVLTVVLLLEAATFYWISRRSELIPPIGPLSDFPARVGTWTLHQDLPINKEVESVLKADDTVSRVYTSPSHQLVYMFVAFFKTQRAGQAPHSPKNCLPGAGWEQVESDTIPVAVPGRQEPIRINHYVVENGSQRNVTLYWYQSRDRIIANEFEAKFWLVADSIRYHRSDTALVKVEVSVQDNDIAGATKTGVSFIQDTFSTIRRSLPM